MAVSQHLLEVVLRDQFGIPEFRPKQREVIDSVLAGNHTLALLPTGYGKSLCYQVPSQVLPGLTLVISPLIALMQDQVSGLKRRGVVNATVLNSHVSPAEQSFRLAGIKAGAFKLVYVAPERFESSRFRSLLAGIDLSLIVIDEAHCISQWGHDFRPHYRSLSQHLKNLPHSVILAVTATATVQVQQDIVNILAPGRMHVVHASFDRPNLRLEVKNVNDSLEKDRIVINALKQQPEPVIVYTSSRKETEALAGRLRSSRIKAAHYHAGMSQDQRMRTQRNFENDSVPVIVSTVAFGMGVDKPNIRHVFHYNIPGSIESYYQEAGRAGRDGRQATCTLLFQSKDVNTQRFLMDRNFPTDAQVQSVFKYVRGKSADGTRVQEILSSMKIGDSALNSTLDLLRHLELIEQDANGLVHVKKQLERNQKIDTEYLSQRRMRESARLDRIIQYGQKKQCRRLQILNYFGQELAEKCEHCDVCHPQANLQGSVILTASNMPVNVVGFDVREDDFDWSEVSSYSTKSSKPPKSRKPAKSAKSPGTAKSRRGKGAAKRPRATSAEVETPSRTKAETASKPKKVRNSESADKQQKLFTAPPASASRLLVPQSDQSGEALILSVVGDLAGKVGRTTVAAVLAGSKAKKLAKSGLNQSEYWGTLSNRAEDEILRHIDHMIDIGELKIRKGLYPKLLLAAKGKKRLDKLHAELVKRERQEETGLQLTLKLC